MSLLALALLYGVNGPSRKERMNIAGASFFIGVNSLMTAFLGTIGIFQGERPVFLRE
jgi:hypothetical protein